MARGKSRNTSRITTERSKGVIENTSTNNAVFKVPTSSSTATFDQLSKKPQNRFLQTSRDVDIKQQKFHKERLMFQIMRKYQDRELEKLKQDARLTTITAREIVDQLERKEFDERLRKISKMMGKKNENPIPKIDRFFAEEPKPSLQPNKKEESKRSRTAFGMTRNRSEQQIKNLMNNCEDFRANITNISVECTQLQLKVNTFIQIIGSQGAISTNRSKD